MKLKSSLTGNCSQPTVLCDVYCLWGLYTLPGPSDLKLSNFLSFHTLLTTFLLVLMDWHVLVIFTTAPYTFLSFSFHFLFTVSSFSPQGALLTCDVSLAHCIHHGHTWVWTSAVIMSLLCLENFKNSHILSS